MVITTERDVFVGAHLTRAAKEKLRIEAHRRGKSMSAVIAEVLDDFLEVASQEQLEGVRSNRRIVNPNEEDVPLPFEITT